MAKKKTFVDEIKEALGLDKLGSDRDTRMQRAVDDALEGKKPKSGTLGNPSGMVETQKAIQDEFARIRRRGV